MWPDSLSLTGGAGGAAGPAGGTANNGFSMPTSTPFNFDSSGWVVNFDSPGASTKASGSTAANATNQTATSTPTSTGSGVVGNPGGGAVPVNTGVSSVASSGSMLPIILAAVGAFLVLGHKL